MIKIITMSFRVCLLLALLCMSADRSFAQQEKLEIAALGGNLNDIAFAGDKRVVAVGHSGVLLISDDRGQTWRQRPTPFVNVSLAACSFGNAESGTVVGEDGLIAQTSDAGQSWTLRESGVESFLHDLHFFDASRGVAVGREGVILTTLDGGRSWMRATGAPPDAILMSVLMTDATTAIAAGFRIVLRSSDGGRSWSELDLGPETQEPGVTLSDVSSDPAGNIYLSGSTPAPHFALKSGDGGKSWESILMPNGSAALRFLADGSGISLRSQQEIYTSDDGGQSWTASSLQEQTEQRRYNFAITAAALAPDGLALAVGISRTIIRSTNGGRDWSVQSFLDSQKFGDIEFRDRLNGIAVGDNSGISLTSDGGVTWNTRADKTIDNEYSSDFTDVVFIDDQRLRAVAGRSENSMTVFSDDGGASWQAFDLPNRGHTIQSMAFADEKTGVMAGFETTGLFGPGWFLYRTSDGGHTWSTENYYIPDEEFAPQVISYLSPDVLVAAGAFRRGTPHKAMVARSLDGGANWEYQAFDDMTFGLAAMHFPDSRTGYAAGLGGVLKSEDAGATWRVISPEPVSDTVGFTSIVFRDASFGLLMGLDRRLRVTVDGGDTWRNLSPGRLLPPINKMLFIGPLEIAAIRAPRFLGDIENLYKIVLPSDITSVDADRRADAGPMKVTMAAISPNPARDIVRLRLRCAPDADPRNLRLNIFSYDGRLLLDISEGLRRFAQSGADTELEVSMAAFKAGSYLVELSDGLRSFSRAFVLLP